MQQVTVWRCCCRETSSNRCSGIAVMEDGRTNHLHCSNLLSAKFNFICFSFPDGAKFLCPGQGMVPCFWMLLKPWWVFVNSGAPSALGQVEPLGLIFPTVSVLGLHMPNITCFCCQHILQEKLFSWGGNAWTGAFYIPIQLSHFGNVVVSSMSWLLIKILLIQLWPVRSSCWEITDLHPLLEMSCWWGWTLCLQKKGNAWHGLSLMERGSAAPWQDDLISLPPEK